LKWVAMKRKQILFILPLLIVGVALLAACGRSNEYTPVTPTLTIQYALDEAFARRESIVNPGREEVMAVLWRPFAYWLLERGITSIFYQFPLEDRISTADALYDVQTLLTAMRQMYGAYIYFGGDAAFVPLFDEISATISTRDYWDTGDFSSVVRDKLFTVATDNHFIFGTQLIEDTPDMGWEYRFNVTASFFVGDIPFYKTEYGFLCIERGIYVSEMRSHDKYDIFRLAVDAYGVLLYTPVVVLPGLGHGSVYALRIVYTGGKEETLYLTRHSPALRERQPARLHWEGDIPIITIMDFMTWSDLENTRQKLSFIEYVQDAPVLIVDVRSNIGGASLFAEGWMNALTGYELQSRSAILMAQPIVADGAELLFDIPIEDVLAMREIEQQIHAQEFTPLAVNHWGRFNTSGEIMQREQLLIILTDRFTASAGESFTNLSFSMNNSLVIGQNTVGAHTVDFPHVLMTLPRSGVRFAFGSTVTIHPENHFAEGIGFAPDIWATGDALEAALAMLRREGLICDENTL